MVKRFCGSIGSRLNSQDSPNSIQPNWLIGQLDGFSPRWLMADYRHQKAAALRPATVPS